MLVITLRKDDGEIVGSDRLLLGYLAKKHNFSYTTIQPPRAFSGLMDMVSASAVVVTCHATHGC